MSKHTIKAHIIWEKWTNSDGEFIVQSGPAHTSSSGAYTQIDICTQDIEFDLPESFDPRPAQIAQLEAKKAEIRAKFAASITEIERQISELQAITFEAGGVTL